MYHIAFILQEEFIRQLDIQREQIDNTSDSVAEYIEFYRFLKRTFKLDLEFPI